MEHIAASEDFIRDNLLKEKVMVLPSGEPGRDVKKIDEAVVAMIPDRTNKAQSPEPLKPHNRFGSPEASVKHFLESGATTEQFLKATTGLRDSSKRLAGKVGEITGGSTGMGLAQQSASYWKGWIMYSSRAVARTSSTERSPKLVRRRRESQAMSRT